MHFFKKDGDYLKDLLNNHKLKLFQARYKRVIRDEFTDGLGKWHNFLGEWHHVTVDTNDDEKAGIEEGLLIEAAGSYTGGWMEREVNLENYGEIVFERYVKNDDIKTGSNELNIYVNMELKLSIKGPSPWRRIPPIGIAPGKNIIWVEYRIKGNPMHKSGVIDTFEVWESKNLNTTISKFSPARPIKNLTQNKTLRGYSRFQEMSASDTSIKFTALFRGLDFHEFIVNSDGIFYFVDEFGVVYRGIFPETIEPEATALNALYAVTLEMVAPQKTGVGFV